MRVFLAAELDARVRGKIAELARELRTLARCARWVRPEGLHLTLRFFGEVPPRDVGSLGARLADDLAGLPAFDLEFRGCGVFPPHGRPRVLWINVAHPPKSLFDLHFRAEACARALGFAAETRPFSPHLTVARFRERERSVGSILQTLENRSFGVSHVGEAILFESRLSSPAARYEALRVIRLKNGPGSGAPTPKGLV